MRKYIRLVFLVFVVIAFCFCLSSCKDKNDKTDIWQNAKYTQDTMLGNGKKTIFAEVVTPQKSITFEIKTDKETLGDALMEHELISGEKGAYGLYVKFVNGMEADYDKDKSYWAIEKEGESLMTGVDSEKTDDKSHYEFIYTKN